MNILGKSLRSLHKISRRQFFWNSKKKAETSSDDDFDSMSNLKPMIDEIKKANLLKPSLLPPTVSSKLTVVVEMDEVLLYTFYPDEHEVSCVLYTKCKVIHAPAAEVCLIPLETMIFT